MGGGARIFLLFYIYHKCVGEEIIDQMITKSEVQNALYEWQTLENGKYRENELALIDLENIINPMTA